MQMSAASVVTTVAKICWVTFDTKVVAVSSRRRGSVPEPPPRNPPSPPAENIYETVLPCSSKDSEEFEPPRG
ncbi:unnamed protein product [Gongylonema pulchrum]|uniref:Secreted protein n=1 Tax=Gongylonema pulchrum TaxID=637853 RepID=A0A183DL06_9BILA|nr:unnamed protein product [Gongylonema pulchrum]